MINLTNRPLSKPQEDVLRLGLNFTPAPTKLPLVDMIAAVEEGARQLNEEDAEDLRGRVCGILRRAKPPKDNLSKEQRKALKELRSLENEVILPADKGKATVMMNREDYDTKMRGMLSTATYKQLKKDPTAMQEGRLSRKLKELEKKGEIPGIYTIDSGPPAANLPGSTASRRSTKMASHSGPLSPASGPLLISSPSTLPLSFPPWQARQLHM